MAIAASMMQGLTLGKFSALSFSPPPSPPSISFRRSVAIQSQSQSQSSPDSKIVTIQNPQYSIAQAPWMLLSSPACPNFRYLYDLDAQKITGKINVPTIAGHRFVGSSQGFLFSVDPLTADLHATNPLTGAHLPLPPAASLPYVSAVLKDHKGNTTHYICSPDNYNLFAYEDEIYDFDPKLGDTYVPEKMMLELLFDPKERYNIISPSIPFAKVLLKRFACEGEKYDPTIAINYPYAKAILSPHLDTVVVIHGDREKRHLAFTRLDQDHPHNNSSTWTPLDCPLKDFIDLIFHKGRLHAITVQGELAVFDLDNNPSGLPVLSPYGPFCADMLYTNRYLVESHDGEDLYLLYRSFVKDKEIRSDWGARTKYFVAFKLDKSNYKWNLVKSIGDSAFFVGSNHSLALYAHDFPYLDPNCVYFTDGDYTSTFRILTGDAGVFNFEDGSVEYYPLFRKLNWPPPIWYMPPPPPTMS